MTQKVNIANVLWGLQMVRKINFDPRAKRGPLRVVIGPTSACNYRCVFCGTHSPLSEARVKPEYMDPVIMNKALAQIRETGTDNLLWAGNGEPTLSGAMLGFINRNEYGYKNRILTNGSMLGRIDRTTFGHISSLVISLNSGNGKSHQQTHNYTGENQFPKIVDNINRLISYPNGQRKITINYVITKDNQDELDDFYRMCHRWGVPYNARPVDASLAGLEYLKPAGESSAKVLHACYVGFIQCYIPVSGDVLLCCGLTDRPMGNIRNDDFKVIWEQSRDMRLKAASMDKTQIPLARDCRGCINAIASSARFHKFYSHIPLLSRWKDSFMVKEL